VQNFSFYDLIVTKARGKSGPLFHFDVHDDVRLVHDARIEKDEVRRSVGRSVAQSVRDDGLPALTLDSVRRQSHPGKVVDRKWYERNKHIFPASRWEVVSGVTLAALLHDSAVHVSCRLCACRLCGRWCIWQYDPRQERSGPYTIHGGEVNAKK
jgi:hypothetical protein